MKFDVVIIWDLSILLRMHSPSLSPCFYSSLLFSCFSHTISLPFHIMSPHSLNHSSILFGSSIYALIYIRFIIHIASINYHQRSSHDLFSPWRIGGYTLTLLLRQSHSPQTVGMVIMLQGRELDVLRHQVRQQRGSFFSAWSQRCKSHFTHVTTLV